MSLLKIGSYVAGCAAALYGSKKLYDHIKRKNNAYVVIYDSDYLKRNSQVHVSYGGMSQYEASWITYFKYGKTSVSYNNYDINENCIDGNNIIITKWDDDSLKNHRSNIITLYNPCDFKFHYIKERNLPDVILHISDYINEQHKINDWIKYTNSDHFPKTGLMSLVSIFPCAEKYTRNYVKSEEDIIKECRAIFDAFMKTDKNLIFLDISHNFVQVSHVDIPDEVVETFKNDPHDLLLYHSSIYAMRENIDILGKDTYLSIIKKHPCESLFKNLYSRNPIGNFNTYYDVGGSISHNSIKYHYNEIQFNKNVAYYKINDKLFPITFSSQTSLRT